MKTKLLLGAIIGLTVFSIGLAYAYISGDTVVLNEGLVIRDSIEVVKNG